MAPGLVESAWKYSRRPYPRYHEWLFYVTRQTHTGDRERRPEIGNRGSVDVRRLSDFDDALESPGRQAPVALIIVEDPLTTNARQQIADFAAKNWLPTICGLREFVEAGALISYGAQPVDLVRRAAGYVDKILKGARPTDLPVMQPTTFELAINLKATKALGLTVPRTLLARADEVIE
jgi:putative ABC transport system substrate-binding protein